MFTAAKPESASQNQEAPELNDTLLQSFSKPQKEYIVKHLYPEINKALVLFIGEAMRHKQIDQPDIFNSSPTIPEDEEEKKSQDIGSSSAFGAFKMGQAQPSNMQLGRSASQPQCPTESQTQPKSVFGQQPQSSFGSAFGGSYSIRPTTSQPVEEEEPQPVISIASESIKLQQDTSRTTPKVQAYSTNSSASTMQKKGRKSVMAHVPSASALRAQRKASALNGQSKLQSGSKNGNFEQTRQSQRGLLAKSKNASPSKTQFQQKGKFTESVLNKNKRPAFTTISSVKTGATRPQTAVSLIDRMSTTPYKSRKASQKTFKTPTNAAAKSVSKKDAQMSPLQSKSFLKPEEIKVESTETTTIQPATQQSVFGGGFAFGQPQAPVQNQQIGAWPTVNGGAPMPDRKRQPSLKGQLASFSMNQSIKEEETVFNPVEQFRSSITEVLTVKPKSRIYNQAPTDQRPSDEYLSRKRGSVFHKAFESGTQVIKDFVPPVYPKSDESTNQLVKLFTDSFLTKNSDPKSHLVLAKAMFSRNFTAGQSIIRYGEMGSEYFVLAKGKVSVTVYKPGTNPNDPNLADKVAFKKVMEPTSTEELVGFGEIALLYNDKRTASIEASTDCETWVLSGDVFKQIIAINAIRRRNISLEYLDKVELFKGLETYDKLKLIDGLKVVQVNSSEFVFHQEDKGDHFYIIEEGKVECGFEQELSDGTTSFELIRTLTQGDHFGEIALIRNVRRTLAVRACEHGSKLWSLNRAAFTRILGSIKQKLKEDYQEGEQAQVPSAEASGEPDIPQIKPAEEIKDPKPTVQAATKSKAREQLRRKRR